MVATFCQIVIPTPSNTDVPQEVSFFRRAHFAGLTSIWLTSTEIWEHFSPSVLFMLLFKIKDIFQVVKIQHAPSFMGKAKCVTFSSKSLSVNAVFALAIGQSMVQRRSPWALKNRSLSDADNNKLVIDQLCACGGWPLVNIR